MTIEWKETARRDPYNNIGEYHFYSVNCLSCGQKPLFLLGTDDRSLAEEVAQNHIAKQKNTHTVEISSFIRSRIEDENPRGQF